MDKEINKDNLLVARGSSLKFIAASHENPLNPGALKKVLFNASTLPSGKVQMLNWTLLPSGKCFQSHYHEDMTEVFVIMSGRAKMTVNSESVVLESGDAIMVPPLAIHSMVALDQNDVQYLVFGVASQQAGKTVVVME